MKVDAQIPSFETTEWLNRKTSGASEGKPKDQVSRSIKGRLLLVHFWSIHSESSILNLSQTAELRDQRRREGLRVIAVHVPNSDAEKDHSAVREAAQRLNLTEPCALEMITRWLIASSTNETRCLRIFCLIIKASCERFHMNKMVSRS